MQQEPSGVPRHLWFFAAVMVLAIALGVFIAAPMGCQSNNPSKATLELLHVRKANEAMLQYAKDHGNRYPNLSGDMRPLLKPYLKDPQELEAVGHFIWNYRYSGWGIEEVENPSVEWVVYSNTPDTGKYAVGFPDGHVEFYDNTDFHLEDAKLDESNQKRKSKSN